MERFHLKVAAVGVLGAEECHRFLDVWCVCLTLMPACVCVWWRRAAGAHEVYTQTLAHALWGPLQRRQLDTQAHARTY